MKKNIQNPTFTRRPVGEVTRGGGFSSLVKEAEAGVVTVLYKFNEPVAILLPCDRSMEIAYEISAGAGAFIANAKNNTTVDGLMERFFRSLIESAAVAKLIMGLDSNVDAQLLEKQILDSVRVSINSKKNSPQEAGSVPPMTTNRGGVSEVKQEELPLGNSSLSRKRGRPKKEPSSPPKRKIGTKREKPAS